MEWSEESWQVKRDSQRRWRASSVSIGRRRASRRAWASIPINLLGTAEARRHASAEAHALARGRLGQRPAARVDPVALPARQRRDLDGDGIDVLLIDPAVADCMLTGLMDVDRAVVDANDAAA